MYIKSFGLSTKMALSSILLCQLVSCLSFSIKQKIPISPLSDPNLWILARIPKSSLQDWKAFTQKSNWEIQFEESEQYYFRVKKSDWDTNWNQFPDLKIESKAKGFQFYADEYQRQIKKNNFEMTDLYSGYKDNILNARYLKEIQKRFPNYTKLEAIGESKEGLPIYALEITKQNWNLGNKVSVLFSCGIHANEANATDHCYDIIFHLLTNETFKKKYLEHLSIWVIPIANPGGAQAFWKENVLYGRKNSATENPLGVDLNRNFPINWGASNSNFSSSKKDNPYYRGTSAASELETQALIRLAERERFVASMSVHAFANTLLYPYTDVDLKPSLPNLAETFGKNIQGNIGSSNPEKPFLLKNRLYPVDGTDQDFYYFEYGTLAYIFETSHLNPEYKYVNQIVKNYRKLWIQMLDEVLYGKKILLRIKDESGASLEADVAVSSISYFQNEKRRSKPSSGIFYQYLGNLGEDGVIVIRSKEGVEITLPIQATTSWKIQEIQMKRNLSGL
ncbi:M14 family metallopeptidase [Leptospira ryugenii]|nr:M14 family metallopeptidase [Leptospira ryugenii]